MGTRDLQRSPHDVQPAADRASMIPCSFYRGDTTTVARKLLGAVLCHRTESGKILRGRIVETEAYLGIEDPACHTFGDRRTAKTRSMYLDGGHSYIYLIYGMHYCLNVVTRSEREPEAVLLRAIEPLDWKSPGGKPTRTLLPSNGPGKLCRYLGLTKAHDGLPMWTKSSGLWIQEGEAVDDGLVVETSRVGVAYAGEAAGWPLRFYIKGNLFVSKP